MDNSILTVLICIWDNRSEWKASQLKCMSLLYCNVMSILTLCQLVLSVDNLCKHSDHGIPERIFRKNDFEKYQNTEKHSKLPRRQRVKRVNHRASEAKMFCIKLQIFSYPSSLTCVLGAQKNRLLETVLSSTHNMFCLINKMK